MLALDWAKQVMVAIRYKAAIAYLKEHGLILTANLPEDNPPPDKMKALLMSYIKAVADSCLEKLEDDVVDMLQSDMDDLGRVEDSEGRMRYCSKLRLQARPR